MSLRLYYTNVCRVMIPAFYFSTSSDTQYPVEYKRIGCPICNIMRFTFRIQPCTLFILMSHIVSFKLYIILSPYGTNNMVNILGDASFDESGNAKYANRKTMSASDRALIGAFREISAMGDRINLPKTIMDRSNLLFKQVRSPYSCFLSHIFLLWWVSRTLHILNVGLELPLKVRNKQ